MAHHGLLSHVVLEAEGAAAGTDTPAEQAAAVLSSMHRLLQHYSCIGTFAGCRTHMAALPAALLPCTGLQGF